MALAAGSGEAPITAAMGFAQPARRPLRAADRLRLLGTFCCCREARGLHGATRNAGAAFPHCAIARRRQAQTYGRIEDGRGTLVAFRAAFLSRQCETTLVRNCLIVDTIDRGLAGPAARAAPLGYQPERCTNLSLS